MTAASRQVRRAVLQEKQIGSDATGRLRSWAGVVCVGWARKGPNGKARGCLAAACMSSARMQAVPAQRSPHHGQDC